MPLEKLLSSAYASRQRPASSSTAYAPPSALANRHLPPGRPQPPPTSRVIDRDGSLVPPPPHSTFAFGHGVSVPEPVFLLNNEYGRLQRPNRACPTAFGLGARGGPTRSRGQTGSPRMAPTAVLGPTRAGPLLATAAGWQPHHPPSCCRCCLIASSTASPAFSLATPSRITASSGPISSATEQGLRPDSRLRLLQNLATSCQSHHGRWALPHSVEALPEGGSWGWRDPAAPSPGQRQ